MQKSSISDDMKEGHKKKPEKSSLSGASIEDAGELVH